MYGGVSDTQHSLAYPSASSANAQWYAAYTRPQHELSVADQASAKGIETMVPLASVQRKWKQRRVRLLRPIFPSYVFVHMPLADRLHVLTIPSVVSLVSFNGKPAVISQEEIDAVRTCVANGMGLEAHCYLEAGRRVRIKRGSLQGIEGVVVEQNSEYKLVVSIQVLQVALAVNVNLDDVEPIANS